MHTTVCNKSYFDPRNINAIHKSDWCMWNMIVAYVVLVYSVSINRSFITFMQ